MRAAAWIALREIAGRVGAFLLSTAVVAAAAIFAFATDALARSGEVSVAAQLDRISAPIEVLPEGVSAAQLARGDLGTAVLAPETVASITRALGASLSKLEPRLVLTGILGDVTALVIGVPGGAEQFSGLGGDKVALGSLLAQRTRLRIGEHASLLGDQVRVGALLPSTGSIEDLAAFAPLDRVQGLTKGAGHVNHLKVFLRPGAAATEAQAQLQRLGAPVNIIRRDRGDAVERDAPRSLELWRAAAFTASGLACATWLAFATRLNLSERRGELATLMAIGARPGQIVAALALRSAATAALGASMGIAVGAVVLWHLGATAAIAGAVAAGVIAATVVLSVAVAVPIGLRAACADPASALEER